jgi:hypothetical protein
VLGYDEPGDTTSIYCCVLGDAVCNRKAAARLFNGGRQRLDLPLLGIGAGAAGGSKQQRRWQSGDGEPVTHA